MAIRLIIFDLDGTLVDSVEDISNALNYALEPYGIESLTPTEVAGMVGDGTVKLIEKTLAKHNLVLDTEQLVRRFAEYYGPHTADHTKAYPGVVETLEALSRYKKAVVSNKYEAFTKKTLDALGLSKYFDMLVCADSIHDRKPSPIPIYHVLFTLDVQAEEAMIVGDSNIDINAGKAASIKTVAVTHGYGKSGFHEEADFVIASMPELIDIVKNIP